MKGELKGELDGRPGEWELSQNLMKGELKGHRDQLIIEYDAHLNLMKGELKAVELSLERKYVKLKNLMKGELKVSSTRSRYLQPRQALESHEGRIERDELRHGVAEGCIKNLMKGELKAAYFFNLSAFSRISESHEGRIESDSNPQFVLLGPRL